MTLRGISRFHYGILAVLPAQVVEIGAALVGILCLGYYVPSWTVRWYGWITRQRWARNLWGDK